jgi:hypothetical protein
MKPGEVVVIRPAPVEGVTEGSVPAVTGRTERVATADAGQGERGGADEESSPYVFDLEINTRWAAIDKALADLRASLLKPQARGRADTRLKSPRTAR